MELADALTILYRGPLSSCNYACPYCPFAKRRESKAELEADRNALDRFVAWVLARNEPTAVFFTPWGEALTRRWYREAIVELSHGANVVRVAVQTNLHAPLSFLERARPDKVGLWCTYHPGQVSRERFLAQCGQLEGFGVDYSVGIVGLRDHLAEIEATRRELPSNRYLWINAYKRVAEYYSAEDLERLGSVDPLFALNSVRHPSRSKACRTGWTAISVDGEGNARRCHFDRGIIGNIYDPDFREVLRPRPCAMAECGCYIGYVHLEELDLYRLYGQGILERIPRGTQLSCG